MKIKTKKQLNLPQLIEWAWENDIRDTFVELKSEYAAKQGIIIDNGGRLHLVGMDYLSKKNTFTIEVEEEITEETKFELMIEIVDGAPNCLWEKASVEDWKDEDSKEFHAYIDGEFKLIWTHDKGLVE